MRRHLFLSIAALLSGVLGSFALAQTEKRIPLAQLEDMFSDMRRKTKWNVDGPLRWGYFFIDPSQDKLAKLSERLRADGYRVVQIRRASEKPVLFQLHVERVEVHSPRSLHERNERLYALASQFQVQSYDGMDVGPSAPSPQ
jgi:Regulator of ribonuclease activity B